MNDYNAYMDNVRAEPALQEKIMARVAKKSRPFYQKPVFATFAVGMTVVLIGVLVIPGMMNNRMIRLDYAVPEAEADRYGIVGGANQANFRDRRPDDNSDTVIIIADPPTEDPDTPIPGRPVTPAPERIELTLQQARHDPHFGTFIPTDIPNGFVFESAQSQGDTLIASWNRGVGDFSHISWVVHHSDEHWETSIVCTSQREQFDVALYPIPWAESVPAEFREVFGFPVFRAEELTLEIVQARMLLDGRSGSWRYAPFAVLYDNVMVQPRVNGVAPEQLYEMLAELG